MFSFRMNKLDHVFSNVSLPSSDDDDMEPNIKEIRRRSMGMTSIMKEKKDDMVIVQNTSSLSSESYTFVEKDQPMQLDSPSDKSNSSCSEGNFHHIIDGYEEEDDEERDANNAS
eukprot:483181_1